MPGPEIFYFAWIDEGEAFDPAVHNRHDEDVFAFNLTQQEGDFAALTCDVKNPRIGLLNTGRKVWCYFSWDAGDGTIAPLFKGRLIAIPSNIFDTVVTFSFTARPSAFVDAKHTLADTLRVLPYWDQVMIDPDSWEDDDVVLEARSALYHIDRVTHEVTISDVLTPEDGTLEFGGDDFFYDNMSMTLQQTPIRSCNVTATFPWANSGAGGLDVGAVILQKWPGKDAILNLINSFTFPGLQSSWPKPGASIGSGWTVVQGELIDETFLSVQPLGIDESIFDLSNIPGPLGKGSIMFPPVYSGTSYGGVDGSNFNEQIDVVYAPMGWGVPILSVAYSASRDYSQVLQFTLSTHTQNIVTDTGGDDIIDLTLTSNPLTDVGYDGEIAINSSARTYLDTPRGQQSVEYCILTARAQLCIRARAVNISFDTFFAAGVAATLRKGALIHDPRLPGGQAAGKLIAYKLSLDGDDGVAIATLTMGSAIGYGGSYVEVPGTGCYAAPGYMADGYQQMTGEVVLASTSDITFQMPDLEQFDDGIDLSRGLTAATAIQALTIVDPASQQGPVLEGQTKNAPDQQALNSLLQTMPTVINLTLVPLNTGPFSGGVEPTVSELIIPKQIDLEAASS